MNTITYSHCPLCNSESIQKQIEAQDFSISGELFEIDFCKECGFHFTQDHPDEADIGPYYQSEDYISHSDTSKGLINTIYHWVRKIMLKRKYLLIKRENPDKNLLDIGCGTGYFLNYMQKKNYQVYGVEKEKDAREFAINNFDIPVTSPDNFLKQTQNEQYDIITLWHVLEHIQNFNEYLKSTYNKLNKDGILIIALPNHQSYDAKYYKQHWAGYDVPRHLWHFDPDTMEKVIKNHGFKISKLKKLPFDSFYNALLSEKYRKNKFVLVSGFFIGLFSYITSIFNVKRASSVIYICEKN